ncbi:hypothetical protein DSECCO2_627530 [anaerobic digester metagenome]
MAALCSRAWLATSFKVLWAISLLMRTRMSSFSTIWFSRTRIPSRMPPSRFWMICTRWDGMTWPMPRVTSSKMAKWVQTREVASSRQMVRDRT